MRPQCSMAMLDWCWAGRRALWCNYVIQLVWSPSLPVIIYLALFSLPAKLMSVYELASSARPWRGQHPVIGPLLVSSVQKPACTFLHQIIVLIADITKSILVPLSRLLVIFALWSQIASPCRVQVKNARQGQYLNIPVVQALGVLVKLHSNREIQVIVAECAIGFRLEVIAVLIDDLRLSQTYCDLAGGKINICWKRELWRFWCAQPDSFISLTSPSNQDQRHRPEQVTFLA